MLKDLKAAALALDVFTVQEDNTYFLTFEELEARAKFIHLAYRYAGQLVETAEVMSACVNLFDKVLPKFNWGASSLDGEAIELLNTVPSMARRALNNLEKLDAERK